jgi:SAM-dependent methyltransferase
MAKQYDRAYYDRWYRGWNRVIRPAELRRKVAFAIAITEYLIDRPLRTVLDVGCGEAAWQPHVRALRPRASYQGIDSSEYAVARFGRTRNVRFGTFGELTLDRDYDLIVCSDVLHYLAPAEIRRGLPEIARHTEGVAFIEFMSREDSVEGDLEGFHRRPLSWYHDVLTLAGLEQIALNCWAPAVERIPPLRG